MGICLKLAMPLTLYTYHVSIDVRNEAFAVPERNVHADAGTTSRGADCFNGEGVFVVRENCVWEGENVAMALWYVEKELWCHRMKRLRQCEAEHCCTVRIVYVQV